MSTKFKPGDLVRSAKMCHLCACPDVFGVVLGRYDDHVSRWKVRYKHPDGHLVCWNIYEEKDLTYVAHIGLNPWET